MTFVTAEETIQHLSGSEDVDEMERNIVARVFLDHPGIELAIQAFYRMTYIPEERRQILVDLFKLR